MLGSGQDVVDGEMLKIKEEMKYQRGSKLKLSMSTSLWSAGINLNGGSEIFNF